MKLSFFFHIFVLFLLGIFFIKLIPFEKYPDYKYLEFRIIGEDQSIKKTPQYMVQKIIGNYFSVSNKYKNFFNSPSENYRIFFFSITVFFCFMLHWIEKFFKRHHFKKSLILFTSFVYPSVLFSITTPSPEAMFTILSIFIVSNINLSKIENIEIVKFLPLLLLCYYFDPGNFLVFLAYLIFTSFLLAIRKYFSLKYFLLMLLLLVSTFLYIENNVLVFLTNFLNSSKLNDLLLRVNNLGLMNLSFDEILKRYIYFFITLLTLTLPSKTFSYITIICVCILILFASSNKNVLVKSKEFFSEKQNQILASSFLLFPLLVICVLPTHAFAKYYLFLIPFIIQFLLLLFNEKKLLVIVILFSILSILEHYLFLNFI